MVERSCSWHDASASAATKLVSMPQKTEMPMSRSASCVRSSGECEVDSMYEWLRWTT